MHGGGNPIPLSSYGGLITLADPTSVPEGASPRTYDTDYLVGQVGSRDGLRNAYLNASSEVGPDGGGLASSTTWVNPNNILADDSVYTTFTPPTSPNSLTVTQFGFSIPPGDSLTGITVRIKGFANSLVTVNAQLTVGGAIGAVKSTTLPLSNDTVILGSSIDLWDAAISRDNVNSLQFGVILSVSSAGFPAATASLDYVSIAIGVNSGTANENYIGTFTQQDGTVKNISTDSDGNLYVEDVTNNPGIRVLVRTDITPDPMTVASEGPDVDYLTFSDGFTGSDIPLQYTPNWIDKITQVGPGTAPDFTPAQASTDTFDIVSITQNPPNSDITNPGHLSMVLQSDGTGFYAPGNVITIYYSPSFYGGAAHPEAEDKTLVDAFHSGVPAYVYIFGTSLAAANGTFLVTSVNNALPPGVDHFRYYFTVQADTSAKSRLVNDTGQYQMTVATHDLLVPVPGLTVGNDITIAGASVARLGFDYGPSRTPSIRRKWSLPRLPLLRGIATYSYSVYLRALLRVAGELVTVTGTTNANGFLNVPMRRLSSASGGMTRNFSRGCCR